jgi:VanZ family protein
MAAIFFVSSLPSPPTPPGIALSDKVAHAIEYFVFGVLAFRAIAGGLGAQVTVPRAIATLIIAIGYAVTDEVHQLFVPARNAAVGDVVADAAGASLALIACRAWNIIATPKPPVPKPGSRH